MLKVSDSQPSRVWEAASLRASTAMHEAMRAAIVASLLCAALTRPALADVSAQVGSTGSMSAPGPMAPPDAQAAGGPGAADAPALTEEAMAPEAAAPPIQPANITVVTTPAELVKATLDGAVDIVISSHLDLRGLSVLPNPGITVAESPGKPTRLALMYADLPLRSIRGNCSSPNPVDALTLTRDVSDDLLPLKPNQCLLIVSKTWLMVNSGQVWIDNLYLKLSRRQVEPSFAFVTIGSPYRSSADVLFNSTVGQSDTYLTGITFHGEHRGNARGVQCGVTLSSFLVDDCIFTDWAGFASPVNVEFQGVGRVHNSTFRNMHLESEIADVSFDGMVVFEDVRFSNVSLARGAIASTTLNDYQQAIGVYIQYYEADDAEFDIVPTPVVEADAGVFGEEFVVTNGVLSDCVSLTAMEDGRGRPGCSAAAITAAKNRMLARAGESGDAASPAGDEYTAGIVEYEYDVYYGLSDDDAEQLARYFELVGDPWARLDDRQLKADDPWLVGVREVLPPLLPDPEWPPFQPSLPPRSNQTSLGPVTVELSSDEAAVLLGTLTFAPPPAAPRSSGGIDVWEILMISIGSLLVAAGLTLLWTRHGQYTLLLNGHESRHPSRPGSNAAAASPKRNYDSRAGKHGSDHASEKSGLLPESGDDSSNSLTLVGVPASSSPHGGRASKEDGNAAATVSDGIDSISDISTGTDVPPTSLLNPNYDYVLPAALSLFAPDPSNPQSSLDKGTGTDKPRYLVGPSAESATTTSTATVNLKEHSQGGDMHTTGGTAAGQPSMDGGSGRGSVQTLSAGVFVPRSQEVQIAVPVVDVTTAATDSAFTEKAVCQLHRQLNQFSKNDLFLGRFRLMSQQQRRRGGQAVVQFVVGVHDRHHYAVKFYLDREAFLTEAALYAAAFASVRSTVSADVAERGKITCGNAESEGGLRTDGEPMGDHEAMSKFLPQVEAVCDSGASHLTDPRGHSLPPCIVIERGESLHDWSDRAQPDLFTALAVLSNVSRRLADMHAAGYVHRDLKPANVMWLARQNRWTLIDFGCVARVGEDAPVSFTLAFAAPEVAAACRAGRKSIQATPALDAWSLGVMALELLTGAAAYDLLACGRKKVVAMLLGEELLPWEGQPGEAMRGKLGAFMELVLHLLKREPGERASMMAFHNACSNLVASTTS